jgi:hypothetical protein
MALTQEEAIALTVHVLHSLQGPAKPTEVAERAFEPDFRAHCVRHGFDLQGFEGPPELGHFIGRCVAQHLRNTSVSRQAVEKVGGNRLTLGPWAVQTLRLSNLDLMRPMDSQWTGLVGEFAVMSELAGCNWNVAKLAHDDGVDVLATKAGELRTVQVKTGHADLQGKYKFSVNRRAHDDYNSLRHYYVLVMRRIQGDRYVNDFIILNTHDVNSLQVVGALEISEKQSWQIKVTWEAGKAMIGDQDMSGRLNRFSTLFI